MATAQTLSPSSTSILKSSNEESSLNISGDAEQARKHVNDFTSAPEIECDPQPMQQVVRQGRGKRRKRRNSINENPSSIGTGIMNQNGKRRRGNGYHKRQTGSAGRIILPTKFLLGGNITDPLNLNSMMDENVNRALNAVTPSSSPLPPRNSAVIDIVTPQDVTDPLGLNSADFQHPDTAVDHQKNKNKRKRRRKSHAMKLHELHAQNNSDVTSNSDDQKLIADSENQVEKLTAPEVPDPMRKSVPQNRKKRQSPYSHISQLSLPPGQANIRDPIVSPAVPQDTRRFRNSFGSKNRRRKNGSGKPGTSDAGIQTDSSEIILEDSLRCGSEKIPDRDIFSPVKRRRTVSENWTAASYWEQEISDSKNRGFFAESPQKKDIEHLLPKPIGAARKEDAENSDAGKSPAKNYMNKEEHKDLPPTKVTQNKHWNPDKETNEQSNGSKQDKKPYTAKFQYGNYNKYYGYRNHEKFKDIRMDCLKKEWFKEKDVLDIGCNAGHLTLLIARDYEPRKIVGIDIDEGLIRTARNNIRHYASTVKSTKFPASMAISLGPLVSPPVETGKDDTTASFPNNVNFFQGNYVPKMDEFLRFQEPEYDVIMCMSVSKWIHLNWGDEGLIRMFRRVFKQLRAGGIFILEPQQWNSYAAKKKICRKLSENYRSIKLKPESFPTFLLKEVGFEKVEHLTLQKRNKASGFQRPIQVYYKPE